MPETLTLSDIQKLQFSDKKRAETAILELMQQHQEIAAVGVELMPKPESLNSVNGFVTLSNGKRYFFKAHSEENEQISEYYNAELLAKAGYPVISAKPVSQTPGHQLVLYEILSLPTLFDLMKEAEDAELKPSKNGAPLNAETLVAGQVKLDKQVFAIYAETLETITAGANAAAPIHQLFQHRLREDGRLGLYYLNKQLELESQSIPFSRLANLHWTINGFEYDKTLGEIISCAQSLLQPKSTPAVIGHGDAHNGNVFVDLAHKTLKLFDPAFAGMHSPLLDMVKPIFHNHFARWMYYPAQVGEECRLTHKISGDRISVEHDFKPSDLRLRMLESRKQNVLAPTLRLLQERKLLQSDWREYMRAALFCCPFLTVNLCARSVPNGTLSERYPPSIKLLGLCMAIEFGADAKGGTSVISKTIADLLEGG